MAHTPAKMRFSDGKGAPVPGVPYARECSEAPMPEQGSRAALHGRSASVR
jgi:hypothetical protein